MTKAPFRENRDELAGDLEDEDALGRCTWTMNLDDELGR
jgi:hypothetical protein